VKFVVREATLCQVLPSQHPSSSTQHVCTKTDPAARRLTPSGRSACLVCGRLNEGRENDIEQFGSVEAQAVPAVVWILPGRFWVGHDRQ